MTQYLENYKKNIVIDMRKKGYSYSEIQTSMHIPKSTIAFWLKDIKLTQLQYEKLKNKQLKIAKENSKKRKLKNIELINEIKETASKNIGKISKKELWLMGVMLYWKERLLLNNDNDIRKGVNFTSSDPYLIKFFLKWLQDVGGIKNEEIRFDIFIRKDKNKILNEIIGYWADVTEFSEDKFSRIYVQRNNSSLIKKEVGKIKNHANFKRSEFGFLRVRVSASSMLVRQISGWMKGIQKSLLG